MAYDLKILFSQWIICTVQPAHKCPLYGLYLCLTERKFVFLSTLLCRSRQEAKSNKQMSTRLKAVKHKVWELWGQDSRPVPWATQWQSTTDSFVKKSFLLFPFTTIATRYDSMWPSWSWKSSDSFKFMFWCTWRKKISLLSWLCWIVIHHESDH